MIHDTTHYNAVYKALCMHYNRIRMSSNALSIQAFIESVTLAHFLLLPPHSLKCIIHICKHMRVSKWWQVFDDLCLSCSCTNTHTSEPVVSLSGLQHDVIAVWMCSPQAAARHFSSGNDVHYLQWLETSVSSRNAWSPRGTMVFGLFFFFFNSL